MSWYCIVDRNGEPVAFVKNEEHAKAVAYLATFTDALPSWNTEPYSVLPQKRPRHTASFRQRYR